MALVPAAPAFSMPASRVLDAEDMGHAGPVRGVQDVREGVDNTEGSDTAGHAGDVWSRGNSAEIRELVCSYDWDCNTAMYIMWRESRGNPRAYNETPVWYRGVENHAVCLFQILLPLHSDKLFGDWTVPEVCIAAAYSLYSETGDWRHWW